MLLVNEIVGGQVENPNVKSVLFRKQRSIPHQKQSHTLEIVLAPFCLRLQVLSYNVAIFLGWGNTVAKIPMGSLLDVTHVSS